MNFKEFNDRLGLIKRGRVYMGNETITISKEEFVSYYKMLGKEQPKDYDFQDLMGILASGYVDGFPYRVVKPIKDILVEFYKNGESRLYNKRRRAMVTRGFRDRTSEHFFDARYNIEIYLEYPISKIEKDKIEGFYKYLVEEESKGKVKGKTESEITEFSLHYMLSSFIDDSLDLYKTVLWFLKDESKAEYYMKKYMDAVKSRGTYKEQNFKLTEDAWDTIRGELDKQVVIYKEYREELNRSAIQLKV